jgi:hypothetical protein
MPTKANGTIFKRLMFPSCMSDRQRLRPIFSLIYRNSLVGLDEGISHGGMSAVIKFTARK